MRNNQQLKANLLGKPSQGQYYLLDSCLPKFSDFSYSDLVKFGWTLKRTKKGKIQFSDRKGNKFSFQEACDLTNFYDVENGCLFRELKDFDNSKFKQLKIITKR